MVLVFCYFHEMLSVVGRYSNDIVGRKLLTKVIILQRVTGNTSMDATEDCILIMKVNIHVVYFFFKTALTKCRLLN